MGTADSLLLAPNQSPACTKQPASRTLHPISDSFIHVNVTHFYVQGSNNSSFSTISVDRGL